MRIFAGIPLPPQHRDQLRKLINTHRNFSPSVRWIHPRNAHFTLKFLGEVEDDRVPQVLETLRKIRFAPLTLRIEDAGYFPNTWPGKGTPNVVWLGLSQGNREMAELAARVEAALEPLGFEPEKRPYRPHLTLARAKTAGPKLNAANTAGHGRQKVPHHMWGQLQEALRKETWAEYKTERAVVWQSTLTPTGPDYSMLAEFGPVGL